MKKVFFIFLLVLIVGCTSSVENNSSSEEMVEMIISTYSLSEVSEHNVETDCWIIVNNQVFDVTDYIPAHPAGDSILQGCGIDSTSMFEPRHSDNAVNLLNSYYIGELVQE